MREISQQLDAELDAPRSVTALLYFLTIEHPRITEPIRAVSNEYGDNVRDHILGGNRYFGIPFQLEIVSDDERPPRGRLSVLNIERKVGLAVRLLQSRPLLTIEQYAASDFTAVVDDEEEAKLPIGTPVVEYRAPFLTLVNLTGNAMWVEGDIASFVADISREPASPIRATQDRFPGLFR